MWMLLAGAGCRTPEIVTPAPPQSVVLTGAAAKGPMLLGSSILLGELDGAGVPTGNVYTAQTTDDLGRFALTVTPPLTVDAQVQGYCYDEVSGSLSTAPLTLRAVGAIEDSGSQSLYINVVTHMAHDRTLGLFGEGLSVDDATAQAEAELRLGLGIGPDGFDPGEPGTALSLLGGDTDANAWLFAVSAVVLEEARLSSPDPSTVDAYAQALLNDIAADLADDGVLDPATTAALSVAVAHLDPSTVMANLQAWFDALGVDLVVPDLGRILGDQAEPYAGEYPLRDRANLSIQGSQDAVVPLDDVTGGVFMAVADWAEADLVWIYAGVAGASPEPVATISALRAGTKLGRVLDAGDVTGDGAADLLLGSLGCGDPDGVSCGAWVMEPPWEGNRSVADAVGRFSNGGADGFGSAVAVLGDRDGDGVGDLAIAGYGSDLVAIFEGPISGSLDPSVAVASIVDSAVSSGVGDAVHGCGDLDGDGLGDLLVTAATFESGSGGEDGALAWFSGGTLGLDVPFEEMDGWIAEIVDPNVSIPAACPGDVDGDGRADFLVADLSARQSVGEPSALLFTRAPTGEFDASAAATAFLAPDDDSGVGYALSAADVNADGVMDFLLGAPSGRGTDGECLLVYGPLSGVVDLSYTNARFYGVGAEQAGGRLAILGDIDGDGFGDLAISSQDNLYLLLAGQ